MSASPKTSTANGPAMPRRTSPSSTVSHSTCSDRTSPPNAASRENASKLLGTTPICSNCWVSDMRRPCATRFDQIDAQEAERVRLVRDLHDSMGHRVAMISIDAELIKQGLPASEKLALHSVENHSPRRTRSFVFTEPSR